MPWVSRSSSRAWASWSKAASSSNEPGTNLMLPAARAGGQLQIKRRATALREGLSGTGGLCRLQRAEAIRLPGYRQVGADRAGVLEERADLRTALVVLPGGVQEPRPPAERHRPAPARPGQRRPDLRHGGV